MNRIKLTPSDRRQLRRKIKTATPTIAPFLETMTSLLSTGCVSVETMENAIEIIKTKPGVTFGDLAGILQRMQADCMTH